jgi:beta-xylosidase
MVRAGFARFALIGWALISTSATTGLAQEPRSGNPIIPGWYADPEAHVFEGRYWIYPTYSAPSNQQILIDAFSSTDLITWEKHPRVLDVADVPWARRALWAPSIIEKDGWYYLFFAANAPENDQRVGGIGVARSRRPDGPFKDYLGKPLIGKFQNGAQPIDQSVFKDRDGSYYVVYGGWGHCNIAKLNADFTGFVPFSDGTTFREITPAGYVEGAFMLLKDNKYYFMWSEGWWTAPNYSVAYAVASSPFGPFERVGRILQQDSTVATSVGHHSVVQSPISDKWYIVYHRRPLGETDNHRVVSIEELHFDERGFIKPVTITTTGVQADSLTRVSASTASNARPRRH